MNKVLPFIFPFALAVLVGCGGGGGGQAFAPSSPLPSPTITSVSVSPSSATIPVGGTQQFVANVSGTGSFNPAVTWEVDGTVGGDPSVGTISPGGLYAALPMLQVSPFAVTVKAVSVQDSTKFGTASSTTHITISVSPTSINFPTQAHQALIATLQGTSNPNVAWSVGPSFGTVIALCPQPTNSLPTCPPPLSPNQALGVYEPPPNGAPVPSNSFMVSVASAFDSSQSAVATLNLVVPTNRSRQNLPVELGTSSGNINDVSGNACRSGTAGSLLSINGANYVLSNNHVFGLLNAAHPGDAIDQPGLVDANCQPSSTQTIANLFGFVTLNNGGTSTVDAAIARVPTPPTGQPSTVDLSGAILALGSSGQAAPPASTVEPVTSLVPGTTIAAKSGRTTGLSCGQVIGINTTSKITYSSSFQTTFTNLIAFSDLLLNVPGFTDPGDSGSLIVDSATAQPIGLLVGGGAIFTFANPISDVLAQVGTLSSPAATASLIGGSQHSVTCPAPSGSAASPLAAIAQIPIPQEKLAAAKAVKENHVKQLIADPAVLGVGVTYSRKNAGVPAILVFVERGKIHAPIPETLDGLEVVVIGTDHFRAY